HVTQLHNVVGIVRHVPEHVPRTKLAGRNHFGVHGDLLPRCGRTLRPRSPPSWTRTSHVAITAMPARRGCCPDALVVKVLGELFAVTPTMGRHSRAVQPGYANFTRSA